ncbi:TPA: hypothetical protein RTG66_001738 [Campylobacter jejuni]|nr:hypothetical protein [Campylobacter jejuni]
MKVFRDKPRSYQKTAKILGIKSNSIFQAQWRLKNNYSKLTHNLDFKIACNCTDEFLELLLDDKNFDGFRLKTLDKLK